MSGSLPALAIQTPDLLGGLARVEGIRANRLNMLAQQQDLEAQRRFNDAAPGLAGQLATADGPQRQNILAQLAGLGSRGVSMALPLIEGDRQETRQRQRPLTAEEAARYGLRPGTVALTNDAGALNIAQQPDTMSPEAMRQRLQLTAAGRAPTVTWSDVRDENGNLVGQRSSTGQYQPVNQPNMFGGGAQGLALQFMTRHADAYRAGTLSPELTRQFESALALYQQPRTTFDAQSGQMVSITPPLPPFLAQGGQPQGAPQVAPQAPPQMAPQAPMPQPGATPAAPAAPQQQGGVPIGTTGLVAQPPGGPQVAVTQAGPNRSEGPSANDRSRLRQIEVEAQGIRDALQTFREMRQNASVAERAQAAAGMPTPLSTAWTNAALLAKGEALYNLGVLNGPDLTIIQRTLSDPSTIRGLFTGQETTDAQIRQIEDLLDQRLRVARTQYGGQAPAPAPPRQTPNADPLGILGNRR